MIAPSIARAPSLARRALDAASYPSTTSTAIVGGTVTASYLRRLLLRGVDGRHYAYGPGGRLTPMRPNAAWRFDAPTAADEPLSPTTATDARRSEPQNPDGGGCRRAE
jgi:hypothetical protein